MPQSGRAGDFAPGPPGPWQTDVMEALLGLMFIVGGFLSLFWFLPGLFILNPRQEGVVLRWGKFVEVIRDEGIHFSNPWGRRLVKVPTTQNSLEVPRTTVVEKNGNPIEISAVVVYHVADSRRASLDVADVGTYVRDQAMAVVKRWRLTWPCRSSVVCPSISRSARAATVGCRWSSPNPRRRRHERF